MTIKIPDPGTGNGATGDNEFVLWSKVKDNFGDLTNAASRIVGTALGNVMEVGAFGVGLTYHQIGSDNDFLSPRDYLKFFRPLSFGNSYNYSTGFGWGTYSGRHYALIATSFSNSLKLAVTDNIEKAPLDRITATYPILALGLNVTQDANGFLKGASPIVNMFNDGLETNNDAKAQGNISFTRLGVGDYLVTGSLGFAQEGWYIETPKDANGNVLVAVVYKQLADNDLSIKTYAKRFDEETGDIVANLTKPRDIPIGRFISLRLHELPKEPPVMPTPTEV